MRVNSYSPFLLSASACRKQLVITLLTLLITACATQPDYRPDPTPPETATDVDLSRYVGKWFEIARYPNAFEKNCQGVTAEYTQQENGEIQVINTCRKGSPDGPTSVAEGRAKVVKNSGNAKLRVSFAPRWIPFAVGDYWILHLEQDYSAALVGDPEGKYLWILARNKTLPNEQLTAIRDRATELGFDASKLVMTEH